MADERNPTPPRSGAAAGHLQRTTSPLTALDVAMTSDVPLSPLAISLLTPTAEHIGIHPPAWLLELASCIGRGRDADLDHVLAWLIAEGAATFVADETVGDTSWRDDPRQSRLPRPFGAKDRNHRNVAAPAAALSAVINSLALAARHTPADTGDLCLAMGVGRWFQNDSCACGSVHEWVPPAGHTAN